MELTRDDDHDTSEEAGDKIAGQLKDLQSKVCRMFLIHKGLTDWELTEKCNQAHGKRQESTYRKRRTELTALGLLMETAERRINPAGNRQKVWSLKPGAQMPEKVLTKPTRKSLKRLLEDIVEFCLLHPDEPLPDQYVSEILQTLIMGTGARVV